MYTLRREGRFYGYPQGCCHCGPDHDPRWYDYKYAITVYNCSLDAQGFVLDNRAPQEWFDNHGQGFQDSCELLARRAAYSFARMCKKPYHVSVCVVGFETAAAEFSFYPEALPIRVVGLIHDYCMELLTRIKEI